MNRHLLPEEIDLLLDNEEGFGMAPLRQHLESCASCRVSYEALASLVGTLERLPHFHPAPLFAERVMERVEVYQPWHVAARDRLGQLVPESSAGRVLMGGVGAVAAAGMTAGLVWVGHRADALIFVGNYGLQQARLGVTTALVNATNALLGSGVADRLADGGPLIVGGTLGGVVLAVLGVAAGVKAVATARRGA